MPTVHSRRHDGGPSNETFLTLIGIVVGTVDIYLTAACFLPATKSDATSPRERAAIDSLENRTRDLRNGTPLGESILYRVTIIAY